MSSQSINIEPPAGIYSIVAAMYACIFDCYSTLAADSLPRERLAEHMYVSILIT